jgi:hypothetical protein
MPHAVFSRHQQQRYGKGLVERASMACSVAVVSLEVVGGEDRGTSQTPSTHLFNIPVKGSQQLQTVSALRPP